MSLLPHVFSNKDVSTNFLVFVLSFAEGALSNVSSSSLTPFSFLTVCCLVGGVSAGLFHPTGTAGWGAGGVPCANGEEKNGVVDKDGMEGVVFCGICSPLPSRGALHFALPVRVVWCTVTNGAGAFSFFFLLFFVPTPPVDDSEGEGEEREETEEDGGTGEEMGEADTEGVATDGVFLCFPFTEGEGRSKGTLRAVSVDTGVCGGFPSTTDGHACRRPRMRRGEESGEGEGGREREAMGDRGGACVVRDTFSPLSILRVCAWSGLSPPSSTKGEVSGLREEEEADRSSGLVRSCGGWISFWCFDCLTREGERDEGGGKGEGMGKPSVLCFRGREVGRWADEGGVPVDDDVSAAPFLPTPLRGTA